MTLIEMLERSESVIARIELVAWWLRRLQRDAAMASAAVALGGVVTLAAAHRVPGLGPVQNTVLHVSGGSMLACAVLLFGLVRRLRRERRRCAIMHAYALAHMGKLVESGRPGRVRP